MTGYIPKGTPMTHASITLKDGTVHPDVVLAYPTTTEADLRVRNSTPETVIYFERRQVVVDPALPPIWDDHIKAFGLGFRHEREYLTALAGEIESIGEAK